MPTKLPELPPFSYPTFEQWREAVQADLQEARFEDKLTTRLPDGVRLQPLYVRSPTPVPPPPAPPLPSTPDGLWQIQQAYRHPSPVETARQIRADQTRGVALAILDIAEASEKSDTSVWTQGLRLQKAEEWRAAFADIETTVPLWSNAGCLAPWFVALRVAAAQEAGIEPSKLTGAGLFDPFGTWLHQGSLPFSSYVLGPLAADLVEWNRSVTPGISPLLASSLPLLEAGGTASHEIAWLLSSLAEWLRLLSPFNLSPLEIAEVCLLQVGLRHDLFLEIAKFRALRKTLFRFWTACGVAPDDVPLRIYARSSLRWKTKVDPWTNLLRTTTEGMAAALGGAEGLALSPLDTRLGPPDDFGRRLASNTHVLLQEESHLGHVKDPAAGSFYLEALTSELADAGWKKFQAVEAAGGLIASLRQGIWQGQLADLRREEDRKIRERRIPILGVTSFPILEQPSPPRTLEDASDVRLRPLSDPPASLHADQASRLALQEMETTLLEWLQGAAGRGAALGSFCRAFESGASLSDLLAVFQRLAPSEPDATIPASPPEGLATAFEDLRQISDHRLQNEGRRPTAFLLGFGSPAKIKPRLDFTRQILEIGGIAVLEEISPSFTPDPPALAAILDVTSRYPDASIFALVAEDRAYPAIVPPLAKILKETYPGRPILLAGKPGESEDIFRKAGVDHFAFLACDALALLRGLLACDPHK